MKNTLVSILIRTVDGNFCTLKKSVESVANQEYKEIEVIIIYQGVNDEYYKKLQSIIYDFPALSFQFIYNETRKDERSKNLNLGIKKAQGRFIGVLDDDDIFYKNHVSLLVSSLSNSNNAWAYSQTARGKYVKGEIIEVDRAFAHTSFDRERLFKENYISMISFIIDRDKIPKNLLEFDVKLTFGEDHNFFLHLAKNGYDPLCLGEFTQIAASIKPNHIVRLRHYRSKYDYRITAWIMYFLSFGYYMLWRIFAIYYNNKRLMLNFLGFKIRISKKSNKSP